MEATTTRSPSYEEGFGDWNAMWGEGGHGEARPRHVEWRSHFGNGPSSASCPRICHVDQRHCRGSSSQIPDPQNYQQNQMGFAKPLSVAVVSYTTKDNWTNPFSRSIGARASFLSCVTYHVSHHGDLCVHLTYAPGHGTGIGSMVPLQRAGAVFLTALSWGPECILRGCLWLEQIYIFTMIIFSCRMTKKKILY